MSAPSNPPRPPTPSLIPCHDNNDRPTNRCSFCATGQQGFTRQLTDSEIFEQALLFSRDLVKDKGERLSNVVFMGT